MPQIITPQVRAHYTPTGVVYTIDNRMLLVDGEIPLALLGSYARGFVIRGGPTDWEAHDARVAGAILIGDGADVASTTTPTFSDVVTFPNTGLHILDIDASHDLIIVPGSDLSDDRTLTLVTDDADRTITLSGNPTLDDWFDQSVKVAASPTFAGVTLGNTGLHLLDTDDSHDLIIAPGSDLGADRTLTLITGDADRTITLTGNPTLNDWFDQSVKIAASPTFATLTLTAGLTLTGASGANIVTVPDNVAQALNVVDAGGIEYLRIGSLDAQPILFINPDGIDADFVLSSDTHGDALVVRGSDGQITLGVLGAGFVQSTAGGILSSAAIQAGDLPAHAAEHEVGGGDLVNHDSLTGFVANEHISHAGVTLTAGAGLTGGGTIEASRSFAVGAGAGITVNANDVALTTPGTLTAATGNVAAGNHTHSIADTADGAANHNVILASGAAGELTMDDYFTVNGGTFGIAGNELLVFNAVGLITVSGANLDLNGNDLILDVDGDSFLHVSADDVAQLVLATASGQFDININGADDFSFAANEFQVPVGSAITMADGTTIGQAAGALLTFDDTSNILGLTGARFDTGVLVSGADDVLRMHDTGATRGDWKFHLNLNRALYLQPNVTDGSSAFFIVQDQAGTTVLAISTDSGRVGIPVTAPGGMLHVDQFSASGGIPALFLDQGHTTQPCVKYSSDGADQDIHLFVVDVTGSPGMDWDESQNAFDFINIAGITVEAGDWYGWGDQTVRIEGHDVNDTMGLYTGNALAISIDNSQGVAMGQVSTGSSLLTLLSGAAGPRPCVEMIQQTVTEEFMRFQGTAAAGVLTRSIVDEGDQASETRAGWLKVHVVDDGNQITDQAYYVPIYTLSA